jgi:hypothetical protein
MKQPQNCNRQNPGDNLKDLITGKKSVSPQDEVLLLVKDYIQNCRDTRRMSSAQILWELFGGKASLSSDNIYYMQHVFIQLLAFFAIPDNAKRFAELDGNAYHDKLPQCLQRLIWMTIFVDNKLADAEMIREELEAGKVDGVLLTHWKEKFIRMLSGMEE